MRRRESSAPTWPEPPAELRTCLVEDYFTPAQVAAEEHPGDLLVGAFTRQRDALLRWAEEHDVPRGVALNYRRHPRYRNASPARRGRR